MNKDEMKGKAENLKGRAKEAFGSVTGDKGKQAEGTAERAKGAVHEKAGEVKGKVTEDIEDSEAEDLEDESKVP